MELVLIIHFLPGLSDYSNRESEEKMSDLILDKRDSVCYHFHMEVVNICGNQDKFGIVLLINVN